MVKKHWNRAFTVAELIITVAVLGVIGAITLGVVRMNAQGVEQKIARAKMMDSVSTALTTMQLDETLAGHSDTDDFANEFTKYYSVSKMSAEEVAEVQAKIPADAKSSLGDDAVYLKSENGEILALSYNKDYVPASQYTKMAKTQGTTATDSVDFRNDALQAVSGYYDVNGVNVGPNKVGVDINTIQPYAKGTETKCSGNFIPNSGGECICSVTPTECVAMGKTFNASACVCEVNCPVGKTYSEEVGACVCTLNADSCKAPYATFDADSCTCKASIGAAAKCVENGGTWDADAATCVCPAASDKNSCEAKSNGYATADKNNFCKCACKSEAQIKALVAQKASGRADIEKVKQYTIPTDDVENGCIVCGEKAASETSYNVELEGGMCVTKGLVSQDPDCVEPFCKWRPFPLYYNQCTLTQADCDAILNKAHEAYFGYKARTNICMTDSNDSCRANVDACIKDPRGADCKNSLKNCSSRTSTPHYGCAMSFVGGSWANSIVNGKMEVVKPTGVGPSANATVNNCYCRVKQGSDITKVSVPRTVYFHGGHGIVEANRFTKFTGHNLPAFKGAYMDKEKLTPTGIRNVMVLESYDSWYDPIVLNINAADAFSAPTTTSEINVPFKDINGKDIITAWIESYVEPSYYFLVKDVNKNNQVDDLSELYSEAGGKITGLQMLNEDFGFKDDAKEIIGYPKLANKGLKVWADMNSNAIVDSGDVFEDLLKLEASEVVTEEEVKTSSGSSVIDAAAAKAGAKASTKTKKVVTYEFSDISGAGVFEIYTGYTMLSSKDGMPERSGNSTIAIQSKYSILKPIDSLSSSKYWVQIVPTEGGVNPKIKYVSEDGKTVTREHKVWTNTRFGNLAGIENMVWQNTFTGLYTNKEIGLYLDVNGQYYEVQVRGLTDVIFDRK